MPRKPGEKLNLQEKKERVKLYNKGRPLRHKIYATARWKALSAVKLASSPLCEECARQGRITAAELVDHIIPIAEGGPPFAFENLQSLCNACHNRKHAQGEGGKKVEKPHEGATACRPA